MGTESQTVGFVGLGNIGRPMALRLAQSDLDLLVYDVSSDASAALVEAGARAATNLTELGAQCGVVCVMVRDDDQVREVVGQLLGAARDDLVVLVHSTISPHTPAELADVAGRHGVRLLDAPVSGGAIGATDGTLAIMVGGDEETFERCREVLGVLGSEVVHAGPVGAGTRFKLARNLLTFTGFAAACEAQRLAEAAGLDLRALGAVVRHTDAISGGPGAIMHRRTMAPLAEDDFWYGVLGNVAALGEKDLAFAVDLAEELQVEVPLATQALTRLRSDLGLPAD